jgi:UDP-galactopyranose mutase
MPVENFCVILGAGLAGLSAAYHLRSPYKIFEASSEVGGVAASITEEGFTFDHAIHVLFTKDPYASTLIKKLLGHNFAEQRRNSWIYSHGVHTPYPYQAHMHGLPKQVVDENLLGLIEARYTASAKEPENFEEWIHKTFGRGIAKNFMLPFNRKVWATEPQDMNANWICDRVMMPELHDIFEGAYQPKRIAYGPNAVFWYPKEGGTGALAKAFSNVIDPVYLSHRCQSIDPIAKHVVFENGRVQHYSSLISTMPLPHLLSKIVCVPEEISLLGNKLRSNRVITVNLGIDRENISENHWVYFPEPEFEFHRISFPANFSDSVAPTGMSSIMVEISESSSRPIERHCLVERTIAQLVRTNVLQAADTIVYQKIIEIDPAYVIYDKDHEESTHRIHDYLHSIGIISCGRFGEWKYLNMDQTIMSGKRAAEQTNHR